MLNVTHIIESGGLILLALFLFSEVGLFLGFFLPGDTLLIAAGIYAHEGKMNIAAVIVVAALAAIAGDSMAYFIGRKVGRRIFRKKNSVLFDPGHIEKAEHFYEKYGVKAVSVSHFLPVVRTFTPLLGGVARMPYPKFLSFDAMGDTSWAIIVSLLGYYVGSRIPNIDHYILLVVIAAVVFSASPTIYQIVKQYRKKRLKG
ncbi:MAG TPA: DedA family protein [Candidatus Saccharimonadales bacterium]|jgi:membrane-associated protein